MEHPSERTAFLRGSLKAEAEVRKAMLRLAKQGSTPAQNKFLEIALRNQQQPESLGPADPAFEDRLKATLADLKSAATVEHSVTRDVLLQQFEHLFRQQEHYRRLMEAGRITAEQLARGYPQITDRVRRLVEQLGINQIKEDTPFDFDSGS